MNFSYTLESEHILVASMHHKHKAIIPVIDTYFKNITWSIAEHLDTDQFGTFSGERERPTDMLGTLSLKISSAFALYPDSMVAIWTEWSFVSIFPWVIRSTEYIMLIDKRFWFIFSTCYISIFNGAGSFCATTWDEAEEYIRWSFQFPEEGCIIYPAVASSKIFHLFANTRTSWITKWITSIESAKDAFVKASKLSWNKKVMIEPDFRANFCPKRMQNIASWTQQLVNQILSQCPSCYLPWWSKVSYEWSACCHHCWSPTHYPTHELRWCIKCDYKERKLISLHDSLLDSCSSRCNP